VREGNEISSRGLAVLGRSAITDIVGSNRHLLVQGAMGLHSSDGLAGKVASARSARFVCVGTISGVGKTPEMLRCELRRAGAEAPGGSQLLASALFNLLQNALAPVSP
jgi:NAD(P)H-dependent flavin oxidoreductase YrpB (nitropropane dioxygenase family)